jgi:hypothetical protein
MTQAKYIERFSVVKMDNGTIGVFERKLLEVIYINDNGEHVGIKVRASDMIEILKYPAQLAFDYLKNKEK